MTHDYDKSKYLKTIYNPWTTKSTPGREDKKNVTTQKVHFEDDHNLKDINMTWMKHTDENKH
eukprot:2886100-Amphidinium_carterae.1